MTPESKARQEAHWVKLQALMAEEELEVIDPDIWYQTSNASRMIARLPEGKTAHEAYEDAAIDELRRTWGESRKGYSVRVRDIKKKAAEMTEEEATYGFHRYSEKYGGLNKQLNHKSFAAFKKAGGGPINRRIYERSVRCERGLK